MDMTKEKPEEDKRGHQCRPLFILKLPLQEVKQDADQDQSNNQWTEDPLDGDLFRVIGIDSQNSIHCKKEGIKDGKALHGWKCVCLGHNKIRKSISKDAGRKQIRKDGSLG
jgi:hypothetical protein